VKRDIDLLRRILLDLESGSSVHDAGEDPQTLDYHIQLLHDAGLIVADELVPGQWWPERITWAGHEFLTSPETTSRGTEPKATWPPK
jgi:hypothetical protein